MKVSQFKSFDELPLFLNADLVAQTLGVATSTAYELMHEKDFPAVRIGNRFIVSKEDFNMSVVFLTEESIIPPRSTIYFSTADF